MSATKWGPRKRDVMNVNVNDDDGDDKVKERVHE